MKKTIAKKWIICIVASCVALAAVCYIGRRLLTPIPFATDYAFEELSDVFPGASGRTYIIDAGKKSVLIVNAQHELEQTMTGGNNAFYYVSLVAEGSDGSVYVSDALYCGKGTKLAKERIFRYDSNGQNQRLVYTIDYGDAIDAPLQCGNIKSLKEQDGRLVFCVKTLNGMKVNSLDVNTGDVETSEYLLPDQYVSDADINMLTGELVFTNRFGQVCMAAKDGEIKVLVDAGRTAWQLSTDGTNIYYTDLAAHEVLSYNISTGEEHTVIKGENILYTAEINGDRICSTDYRGYYTLENGAVSYIDTLNYSQGGLRCVIWALLIICALLLIVLFYIVAIRPRLGKKKSQTFQRMIIVISVSLCIGVLVTYISLDKMVEVQNESIMEQLNLFDDILLQQTNVEALESIDSVSDFRNDNYNIVKDPLDRLMNMTYNNGIYYYYVIYKSDGKTIYAVMDYENTLTSWHPTYTWGVDGYTRVLENGDTVNASVDVSFYGSRSYVLKPIMDDSGKPIGIMEVGTNLDDLNFQTRSLILELVFTVISMSVVLLMLIIEFIFYLEHKERRLEHSPGSRFPMRTLVFLMFLADCMQDPFVSILAKKLYVPFWGISQGVGAALPLSAQVFTSAISALVCGSLVRRTGVKRMLTMGYIGQILGFLLCGTVTTYFGLLAGKALIGIGMGALIVSLNSVSAAGDDEEENAESFTAINAGTLAGITAGAGVGSIVLSFSSFSTVYYAGAIILLIGLMLAISGGDYKEIKRKAKKEMGLLSFIAGKQVWTFLLLILMPFLIAISFREYLFPLFAEEAGISGADIGRIYLACGLIIIYLGPWLTRVLIERLGSKWTMVIASAAMISATILFAVFPTLPMAVLALLLLSIAISFGYAAQSTYYANLPRVGAYGKSRAMGIYSLFDNGGQALGPVIYGAMLLSGYNVGVMVIGASLLALLLIFLAVNTFGKRHAVNDKKHSHR